MLAVAEIVKFIDAPAAVCAYLRGSSLLAGIYVGTVVPTTRPAEFFRVLRTGGIRETVRSEAAQITVEAWAANESRAYDLLSTARALLNAADSQIYGVREFAGPANLPDPATGSIRYTMTFQIRARGTAVTA